MGDCRVDGALSIHLWPAQAPKGLTCYCGAVVRSEWSHEYVRNYPDNGTPSWTVAATQTDNPVEARFERTDDGHQEEGSK